MKLGLVVMVAVAALLVGSSRAAPSRSDERILSEIESLVSGSLAQVGAEASLGHTAEKPRPPKLDDTISNLRSVMDRLAMENVNSVANQQAMTASFESKRASIMALLSPAQQGLISRQEQRKVCEQQLSALSNLAGIVKSAVEHDAEMGKMREEQSQHYTQITEAMKGVTTKNKGTLDKIIALIGEEISQEQKLNGASHFDPVSLRQRQPEDMLSHIKELTTTLGKIMDEKLENQDDALAEITSAFLCPSCEATTEQLENARSQVEADAKEAKERCMLLTEGHRALDEADREKVLELKKELGDLDEAERIHRAAEEALESQRKQGEHIAQKMVGFYQNLPTRK